MKFFLVECREAGVTALFTTKEVAIESIKATWPAHTAEFSPFMATELFESYTLVRIAGFTYTVRAMTPRTDVEQL